MTVHAIYEVVYFENEDKTVINWIVCVLNNNTEDILFNIHFRTCEEVLHGDRERVEAGKTMWFSGTGSVPGEVEVSDVYIDTLKMKS